MVFLLLLCFHFLDEIDSTVAFRTCSTRSFTSDKSTENLRSGNGYWQAVRERFSTVGHELNCLLRSFFFFFFFSVHIPKARYYEQLECTKPTKDIPRGLPDLKCFESYLSRLGVSNDDHVVLYDRSPMGLYASSRAWWVLRVGIVWNDRSKLCRCRH